MNKGLNTIGMCKCANKISYGETLIKDIKNHSVEIVVICKDTSDNSKKKIIDKCQIFIFRIPIIKFCHGLYFKE